MDVSFCVAALEEALATYGTPEIFNTDQGSQFTSVAFTGALVGAGIKISMDGRGRWMDNVFIERLWRLLKHEDIYLKGYADGREAKAGIASWIAFYNDRRLHQSLGYRTAGCPGDEQILVAIDPATFDEFGENGAVDAPRGAQIDVLDASSLAQCGDLEARGEPPGVAFGGFAVDQQADAIFERQGFEIGRSALLLEGLGHSGQAKLDQPFVGWVVKHAGSLLASVEVVASADVAVAQGLVLERFVEERAIEAVLEDRSNRGDGARLDEDAPPAGCVEAFGAVAFDERQNAKAGSKALFWMGPGVDHGLEKRCCRRTDPLAGGDHRAMAESG
ncbi:hypothetical protein ABIF68_005995 [Bradyrhizobium japonicum]